MNPSTFTFKMHPVSPVQLLWLRELAHSPGSSQRIAKVRLFGQLPRDFSPDSIDPRLFSNGRLTPIGLWHVDHDSALFSSMDKTIADIQRRIRANPMLAAVTAVEIADQIGLTEPAVSKALFAIGELGNFFSQAQVGGGNSAAYSSIQLTGETSCDEYLRYTNMDELLERAYVQRGRGLATSVSYSARHEQVVENDRSTSAASKIQGDDLFERAWTNISMEVRDAIQAGWANGMPPLASALYARWWQLESWLRSLVYVELKAALGNQWVSALPKIVGSRQQSEDQFQYMATPDAENRLAYSDASALFKLTIDHWRYFAGSVPAKNVWAGRIEELLAIRNRIGHCRRPHGDDLVRLEQTLRDLNRGAFAAAAAYNDQLRAAENWSDVLVENWVRMQHETAVRLIQHAERQYETAFELRYSRRPWSSAVGKMPTISGTPGYLWHAFWYFKGGRPFFLDKFWMDIEAYRDLIVFVCAEDSSSISISFSALEDPRIISDVIGHCFDAALSHIGIGQLDSDYLQWQTRFSEIDPIVQVGTPWSSIDKSMRGISFFSA